MTILAVKQNADGNAVVTARSGMTGNESDMVFPMSKQDMVKGLADHSAGALIQNVFPLLTADQREFLMTGITPAEWDDAFNEDGEYDDDAEDCDW